MTTPRPQRPWSSWVRMLLLGVATFPVIGLSAGADRPFTIDGTWAGFFDGMGGTVTLQLSSRAGEVRGTATLERGALGQNPVRVSGTWRPPRLVLTLHIDAATTPTLDLRQVEAEKLVGIWAWSAQTTQPLTLVRP